MTMSPEEIVDLDLKLALRGYATDQVDELLDRLADQIERNEAELSQLRGRVREAEARAASAAEAEATVHRTLVAAQTTADRITAEAEQTAASLREEAERAAADLREEAEQTAMSLREEAEVEARERLQRAEEQAQRLIAEAEQRHQQLQERFEADTRDLQAGYESEHRQLQAAYDAQRARFEDHLDALQTQASTQVRALRDHLEAQKRALDSLETELYSAVSDVPASGTDLGGTVNEQDNADGERMSDAEVETPNPPPGRPAPEEVDDGGELPVGLQVRVREDHPVPQPADEPDNDQTGDDHDGRAEWAG